MLAVVVEHGDVGLVAVESGVVLPAEVGCLAIAEVFELVVAPAKGPDGVAVGAIDEGEEREMT